MLASYFKLPGPEFDEEPEEQMDTDAAMRLFAAAGFGM